MNTYSFNVTTATEKIKVIVYSSRGYDAAKELVLKFHPDATIERLEVTEDAEYKDRI